MTKDQIQEKLQQLLDVDSNLRKEYVLDSDPEKLEKIKSLDEESTNFVKHLITTFGFPTISRVGKKSSYHAWKLVQHSADLNFQSYYLTLMEKNLSDVNKRDYAYLKDRVLLSLGEKQIFGTQFMKNEKGDFVPINLDDPLNVNLRRVAMELDTLEENIERMKKYYGSSNP